MLLTISDVIHTCLFIPLNSLYTFASAVCMHSISLLEWGFYFTVLFIGGFKKAVLLKTLILF